MRTMLWLFLSACVSYKNAWVRDGRCYSRCITAFDRRWMGGKYGYGSDMCICVVKIKESIYTAVINGEDDGERYTFNPKWELPGVMRMCADRSQLACGAIP